MIDLLLVAFQQTLDDLLDTDMASPEFLKLMEEAENYLDTIQVKYGQQIYEMMDEGYSYILMLKGEEIIIDYKS